MKRIFLIMALLLMFVFVVTATEQNHDETSRTKRAREKLHTMISPNYQLASGPDAEFMSILENFVWGETFYHGSLTDRQRIIILLAVMNTNQNFDQFRGAAGSAVRNGLLSPIELKEIVYMSAPYIGFPRALSTLAIVNEVLTQQGITLPLESQSTVTEETRYAKGLEIQNQIIGGDSEQLFLNRSPENQKHIYEYLTAMAFGDLFTRTGLDLPTRQMIVFCMLATLGDTERQLRGHILGNLNVGNSKEFLVDVTTQMLPHIGFPRTLNVLTLINEINE